MEEYLPDGLCGEILDKRFVPSAQSGDFDAAFSLTVEEILRILQKKTGFTIAGVPQRAPASASGIVKLLLTLLVLAILFSRPGRTWILPFLIGQMLGGRGYSSRGGGGFSGGGFGGFGGGFSGGGGAGRSF